MRIYRKKMPNGKLSPTYYVKGVVEDFREMFMADRYPAARKRRSLSDRSLPLKIPPPATPFESTIM